MAEPLKRLRRIKWRLMQGWFLAICGMVAGTPMGLAGPVPEGLFTTLQTTAGDIKIDLEFEEAPRTCANFLSLAEGTRTWLDPVTARPRNESLYSGAAILRVWSNILFQAGAPNNDPAKGPGYRFNDEFSTNLRHSATGTVSMANRGPDSNGSQFFITMRPLPPLDFDQAPLTSAHAVFGYVTEGLDVVASIGTVATVPPDDGAPISDITITNILVERIGAAAESFDPASVVPPLPEVRAAVSSIETTTNGNVLMTWNAQPGHQYWIFQTTNLVEQGWKSLLPFSTAASGFFVDVLYADDVPRSLTTVEVEYH